ncbi:Predicted cell-wall-anchored protein SasA (LPXTG motif), partial [hydrothermal vent metagenome]
MAGERVRAMPVEALEKQTCTHEALEACVEQGSLYVIVDAIAHNDVSGFAAELVSDSASESASESTSESTSEVTCSSPVPDLNVSELVTEDAVPHLLKVSARFWRFLNRDIWQQGDDAPAPDWGLFLQLRDPELAFSVLLEHWRRWYRVELPDQMPAVFRFFDPRLIDAFLDVSSPAEQAVFFGPVCRLLLPQADGSARIYNAPVLADTHNTPGRNRLFIMRDKHLKAMELRRLEQRIPAFRAYLEKHFEDDFQYLQITDRDRFIREGLGRATEHGFFSEQATLGWLSLQLLHGPDFATTQPWAIDILNEKRHTLGNEDRADRLINAGFDKAVSRGREEI